MLRARQDQRVIQPVTMMILRTREQQSGTGIFYHTPLRREAYVPDDPEDFYNPRLNSGAAGLSSKIGGQFTEVPKGSHREEIFGILGTIVETPKLLIPHVEGDELTEVNPNGVPMMMEILKSDLQFLQEQNQMFLLLHAQAFVQFNAQDYGEGFDEDGRDRSILRGSFYATPHYFSIETSRPELKSAAASSEEIHAILEEAKRKSTQRAVSARAESIANRAERDERRAMAPMPARRGTNTHVTTYQDQHKGVGNKTF